MVLPRKQRTRHEIAVNDEATLIEVASRDIWQCRVVNDDDEFLGHAVGQIIEPRTGMIRYLVLLDPCNQNRLLLPASFVTGAEPNTILTSLTHELSNQLPVYHQPLTRDDELHIFQLLDSQPYWIQESHAQFNWTQEPPELGFDPSLD